MRNLVLNLPTYLMYLNTVIIINNIIERLYCKRASWPVQSNCQGNNLNFIDI